MRYSSTKGPHCNSVEDMSGTHWGSVGDQSGTTFQVRLDPHTLRWIQECREAKSTHLTDAVRLERRLYAGSWEWLRKRQDLITASDIATIIGVSKYVKNKEEGRAKLLKRKLMCEAESKYENKIIGSTPAVRHGKMMEAVAINLFSKQMNLTVDKTLGMIVSESTPFIGATPDGLCLEVPALVEVKCPYRRRPKPHDDILIDHFWQMQCQMYCTGIHMCFYVNAVFKKDEHNNLSLDGKYSFIRKCEFEPDTWRKKMSLLEGFYSRMLVLRATGMDDEMKALYEKRHADRHERLP